MDEIKNVSIKEEGNANRSLGLQDLYKAAFSQECEKSNEVVDLKEEHQASETFAATEGAIPSADLNYQIFDSNVGFVLDLDKGVPVQVVRKSGTETTYNCDSHILHRYLQDSSFPRGDCASLSNSSADSSLPTLNESVIDSNAAQRELRFEDCEFNSSDSFASTESIIPKNIKCPKCPKKFMFKSDLFRHDKNKHTLKEKRTCTICLQEFNNRQCLIYHARSHCQKLQKEFKCLTCKKMFKIFGTFVSHITEGQCLKGVNESDSNVKLELKVRHFCNICNKSYSKKKYLTSHMKTHENAQKTAQIIKIALDQDSSMKLKMEDEEKTYELLPVVTTDTLSGCDNLVCGTCKMEFSNPADFPSHLLSHRVQEKPRKRTKKPATNKKNTVTHTQEIWTQTEDVFPLQTVNVPQEAVMNQRFSLAVNEPFIITPIGSFNSVPIIITPSQTASFTTDHNF